MEKLRVKIDEIYCTERTEQPGVYVFYNGDEINYIGKSSNLIDRIKAHLDSRTYRVRSMMLQENTSHIDFYPTKTEQQAYLMEYQLIHKYQPKLNRLWIRSKRNFPSYYIRLTADEDFPRILISKVKMNASRNFGPFPSMKPVKNVVNHLTRVYPIADCPYRVGSKQLNRWKKNCERRQIGECLAPCDNDVSLATYKSYIDTIGEIMSKDNSEIIAKITDKMQEYSDDYDFENAKKMKELIRHYNSMFQSFELPVL